MSLEVAYTVRLNGQGKGSIEYIPAREKEGERVSAKPCDDCDSISSITIEPYGSGHMATIECPNCGVSYDTNLDPIEGEGER